VELDALMATLEILRAGVLEKVASLSEADARHSTVPSGTNLAGLLQHLTFVEAKGFEQNVAGREPTRGKRSMDVDPATTLSALRAAYRDACAASNEIVAQIGDPDARLAVAGARTPRSPLGDPRRHHRDRPSRGPRRHRPRAARRQDRPVIG